MSNNFTIWRRQPQILTPINRQLIGDDCSVWSATNSLHLDLRGRTIVGSEGGGNDPDILSGIHEACVANYWTDGSEAGIDFGVNQPFNTQDGFTYLVVGSFVSSSVRYNVASQRRNSSPRHFINLLANYDGDATVNGAFGVRTDNDDGNFGATSQFDSAQHCWVLRNGRTTGDASIHRDGIQQTLAFGDRITAATITNTSSRFRVGNLADSSSSGFTCTDPVSLVVCWPRRISDGLAELLSSEPWLIYQGIPTRQIWAPSAAGLTVGRATETDTSLALSLSKEVAVGLSIETDTAFAPDVLKNLATGRSDETDTALSIPLSKVLVTGRADETDSALAPTLSTGAFEVGLATETDTAFSLQLSKQISAGLSSESDSALSGGIQKRIAPGLASETDTALAPTLAQPFIVRMAVETDTALALSFFVDPITPAVGDIPISIGGVFPTRKPKTEKERFRFEFDENIKGERNPIVIDVGLSEEADEAMALPLHFVVGGLLRTKPKPATSSRARFCSNCGAGIN